MISIILIINRFRKLSSPFGLPRSSNLVFLLVNELIIRYDGILLLLLIIGFIIFIYVILGQPEDLTGYLPIVLGAS